MANSKWDKYITEDTKKDSSASITPTNKWEQYAVDENAEERSAAKAQIAEGEREFTEATENNQFARSEKRIETRLETEGSRMKDLINDPPGQEETSLLSKIHPIGDWKNTLRTIAGAGELIEGVPSSILLDIQRKNWDRIAPNIEKVLKGERPAQFGDVFTGAGLSEPLSKILGLATGAALTPTGKKSTVAGDLLGISGAVIKGAAKKVPWTEAAKGAKIEKFASTTKRKVIPKLVEQMDDFEVSIRAAQKSGNKQLANDLIKSNDALAKKIASIEENINVIESVEKFATKKTGKKGLLKALGDEHNSLLIGAKKLLVNRYTGGAGTYEIGRRVVKKVTGK